MRNTEHPVRVHAVTRTGKRALLIDVRPIERRGRLWRRSSAPAALPPVEAGAHVDLRVGSFVRQYSLVNAPGETHRYLVCVQAEPEGRGGSVRIHDTVDVGTELIVSAPRNRFPLVPAQRTLLIAGGIGVTPLLSMAEALSAAEAHFELHLFSSDAGSVSLREHIEASAYASRVTFHTGERAQRDSAAEALLAAPHPDARLYLCGPEGFMAATVERALVAGWPPSRIHQERFAPAEPSASESSFTVELASDGRRFAVPAGATIARVLREGGVPVDVSCEQGMCGTCLTRVVAGVPDHRDVVQTDEEKATNAELTLCCSRSLTPELVIDL